VNELPTPPAATGRPAHPPRARAWARLALAGAVLLCGFARGQDPGSERMVARDAARLLAHRDPLVRGEAALVAASVPNQTTDLPLQSALLRMARDPDADARHRAILALGLLGSPTAVQLLADRLGNLGTRGDADGPVLGYALGSLPAGLGNARTEVLNQFVQGSFRRQRDTMLGLLLGMARHGRTADQAALQRLFANEANRDPEVRALLLHLLLPQAPTDALTQRRHLERGEPAERDCVLRWLGEEPTHDPDLLALLERIASRGDTGAERARALAALTRANHPPVLELAAKALRSDSPGEAGQAMRSMLTIGGPRLHRALDERLQAEADPARKLALLTHFDAPPSPALVAHASALAVDAAQPFELRSAAAILLARAAPDRGTTVLRDLFRIGAEPQLLGTLAQALQGLGDGPPALDRLLDGSTELHAHPSQWQALLRAGHPEATRQVMQHLDADTTAPDVLRTTLTVWRRAMVTSPPRWRAEAVPSRLRELLAN
jgi:HEAT repeats